MASSSNQEIESRGATVDAAVAAGLQRLGVSRDRVTVIVIDEGSRGLLGIGSREAIVRLAVIPDEPVVAPPRPAPPAAPPAKPIAPVPPPPTVSVEPQAAKPAPVQRKPVEQAASRPSADDEDEGDFGSSVENLEAERQVAVEVISELLEKMHVNAEVKGYVTEPDDLTGQQVNIVDISGDDLGVLIGPRGETLDSLQFLSRLMVAHRLHRRSNFVVDVEGFRQRREQALTRLAERMAEKARQRGEPISLEPMSAYERRIIHMTLRGAEDVYTESTGEGKQRRVRIFPNK
jgi:spoIIIJ-associated protein